jgi:hypothetical protein
MSEKSTAELLAEREAKRAEDAHTRQEAHDTQRLSDLDALEIAEAEHGATNVAFVNVPYTPGLPTIVIVRVPSPPEMKRYRFLAKPKKPDEPLTEHITAANEAMADTCLAWPAVDVFAKICDARPGVKAQCGGAAVRLSLGHQEEEGKG